MTEAKVVYRGPAPIVGALAHRLRFEGVEVRYEPPTEGRNLPGIAGDVIVNLLCSGALELIRAGVQKFRASDIGGNTEVEIEGADDRPTGSAD